MAKKQSGGINIRDVDRVDVKGDMVGRDKIDRHEYLTPRDEKNGCLLFVERAVAFVFSLLIAGGIFGLIGAFIASAVLDESGAAVGVALGVLLGLGFAVAAASNVSRFRD